MSKTSSNIEVDQLFGAALDRVRSQRAQGAQAARQKTSAPKTAPTPTLREKLSRVHTRNNEMRKLAKHLQMLGTTGFEKVAMDEAGSSPGGDNGGGDATIPLVQPIDGVGTSTREGRVDPVATHTLNDALMSGENPDTSMDNNPITTRDARGGPGATLDQGNLSTAEAPAGGVNTMFPGDSTVDLSTDNGANTAQIKSSQLLYKLSGGSVPTHPRESWQYVAARMNIRSPDDALFVLKQSAIRRGIRGRTDADLAANFCGALNLGNEQMGQLWRAAFQKQSMLDEASGMGEGGRDEIAEAKDTVEAVVKSTGELPTSDQVAEASGTSLTAANVAIFETAELIAATGGQVSAPGQAAQMAPAPMPPGMGGAMPPGMGGPPMGGGMPPGMGGGMPPMPPQGPPPGMAPPMPPMPPDPSGGMGGAPMGGPPMGDPSMGAPPPGAPPAEPPPQDQTVQSSPHPARLGDAIFRLMMSGAYKQSMSDETIGTTEEATTGGRSNAEMVITAGSGLNAPTTELFTNDLLNPPDKAIAEGALGSNQKQVTTGPQDVDVTLTETNPLRNNAVEAKSAEGLDTKGEDVKGTSGTDMLESGMKTAGAGKGFTDLMMSIFPDLYKRSEAETYGEMVGFAQHFTAKDPSTKDMDVNASGVSNAGGDDDPDCDADDSGN